MKKCPFCAEEIQDEAIKCKHCGEWLEKAGKDSPLQEVEAKEIAPPGSQPQEKVVSTETDEEIKRTKEAGQRQCPTCGRWDVHRAYIEDGSLGDWCPHCKKSIQQLTQIKTSMTWLWIFLFVGGIILHMAYVGYREYLIIGYFPSVGFLIGYSSIGIILSILVISPFMSAITNANPYSFKNISLSLYFGLVIAWILNLLGV